MSTVGGSAPGDAAPIFAAPIFAAPIFAAPIFAALGDACRWSIVARLCEHGPLPTTALRAPGARVSRQGLTKHLRVLEEAGLVDSVRVGRDRHWRVRTAQLDRVRAWLDQVSRDWDARLARLDALVTEPAAGPTGG